MFMHSLPQWTLHLKPIGKRDGLPAVVYRCYVKGISRVSKRRQNFKRAVIDKEGKKITKE